MPKSKKGKDITIVKALETWRSFTMHLSKFSEKELEKMLQLELKGKNRRSVKGRIHSRLTKLKNQKERKQLLDL
jgi:DNA-binding transcriptional ArsR family regulator